MIKGTTADSAVQKGVVAHASSKGAPLVSQDAIAGFGNEAFRIKEEDIQGKYLVPDFNGIDFMIRVKGSSMHPKYSSGDIAVCRIIQESAFIQWNTTYVIATREQGILCKRLRKSELADHLLAVSDNKDYPPFDIPREEITGIALIIGTILLEECSFLSKKSKRTNPNVLFYLRYGNVKEKETILIYQWFRAVFGWFLGV